MGPEFVAQLHHVQRRYAAMVLAKKTRASASPESLHDHLCALRLAIRDYAQRLCATVETSDPPSVERATRALRPIVHHREAVAQRRQRRRAKQSSSSSDRE